MKQLAVIGAYGRNYTSAEQALSDWNAGRDFQFAGGGPYCSKREMNLIASDGYTQIVIMQRNGKILHTLDVEVQP